MARESLFDDAGVDFIEPPCEECKHHKLNKLNKIEMWAYCDLDGICEFEEMEN